MGETPTLGHLASYAMDSISNLCESDEEFEKLDSMTDLEKIRMRYKHADCDDLAFALSVLMDWPVVCAVSPSQGPIHRLAQVPVDSTEFKAGAYVDVDGYISEKDLCKRYKSKKLQFVDGRPFMGPTIADDDELRQVMATFQYLPFAPFSDPKFQIKVDEWIESGNFFEEALKRRMEQASA